MSYKLFLDAKKIKIKESGFDVVSSELNQNLFDFQKFIVSKALKAGKYAIFADCGLGKTLMQLEWAYQVEKRTRKPVLIIAPLAVTGQTIGEGEKFGISVDHIVNYEQLEKIDCSVFSGVVIDESSILKNFDGAYRNLIIQKFHATPYKLACTATPSPNDVMELGNHAEFLNLMSRSEMLATYFVHDGGETAKWRLKGHSVDSFWKWVSSWSMMLSKPSDIGFDSEGYELPELKIIEKEVKTSNRNNGTLFNDIAVSAIDFNKELKITLIDRIEKVEQIVNNSRENFIVWVKQNEESASLKKLIPGSVEVKGSDDVEYKKNKLLGFAKNEFRVLITKAKIAQFGLNYQNCHNQIFASFDFSFESLYQAIRRSYRFGQKHPVNIYLITTDTMQNVVESIKKKQSQFEQMQKQMTKHINTIQL